MSIKNQNRFTIFASLIVGVAILAFVALNLIVDKVSKINNSQVVQQEPGRGPRPTGAFGGQGNEPDDAYKAGSNPDGTAPGHMPNMPSDTMQGAPGAMRRLNNGKNAAEFEQKAPAPSSAPRPSTPTQPDNRQGPPAGYPDPSKMSPEERDAFEREMIRRQQMMQGQPEYDYPPEYYNPYDHGYEDDYDYDPGYRGQKTDAKGSPVKLSDSAPTPDYNDEDDEEYDPDDYLEDDLE